MLSGVINFSVVRLFAKSARPPWIVKVAKVDPGGMRVRKYAFTPILKVVAVDDVHLDIIAIRRRMSVPTAIGLVPNAMVIIQH